ncbi:TetR/AcrR family transcriptional regulator [Roseobacter sp. EG26]|uniref:TetR/AcrR family transcriptional regulator n=1 Tax=Roseobacter sp. EG26 TaxID=3412477 RepID=UPI003CE55FDF
MKHQRLTRQSWIDAGLEALVASGPVALAAEPLARALGATKGSFYWHFKDVPEFQHALLKDWQSRALMQVADALAKNGNAEERLRDFGARILGDVQDSALRAWARTSTEVAEAVAQVDAERLRYITSLLQHLGVKNPGFALCCLGALAGLPQVGESSDPAAAYETLVDLVLALK